MHRNPTHPMNPMEETMDRIPTPRTSAPRPAHARSRAMLAAALAVCTLVAAAPAGAGTGDSSQGKLNFSKPQPKQTHGGVNRGKQFQSKQPTAPSVEPVRLEGTLTVGRDGVVRMGDNVLLLRGNADMLSDGDGRLLAPDAWDGRAVTVYGRRTASGIRVSLIIDHGDGTNTLAVTAPVPPNAKPSDSDQRVGELSNDSPK